jgi:hypothetical protein
LTDSILTEAKVWMLTGANALGRLPLYTHSLISRTIDAVYKV